MLHFLKSFIRQSPTLYFGLLGWRVNVRRLRARKDSELVLEAFPRSANTTSMYALFYAQGSSLRVGHHLHVPAHVKYAVRHRIPCLVIMREPLDCIASLMIMRKGGDPRLLLLDYIDFARVALSSCEHIVIVSFNCVINQGMGHVVRRLNQRYGASFREPDGSAEEQAWVKDQVRDWNLKHSGGDSEKWSFPTEASKKKGEGMKERIRQEHDLLSEANRLYLLAVEAGEQAL